MRSIFSTFPGVFLLCVAASGAGAADDAAQAETVVPILPPAVELGPPAVTIEWAWVVPAADGEGERLADEPPEGETAIRIGTLRFHYEGTEPAAALRIVSTVPEQLEYLEGSATGPGAEADYDAATRQVTWTIPGPLDPGTRGLVSFRAVPSIAPEPEVAAAP